MFLADLMRLSLESPPLGRQGAVPALSAGQTYFRWQADRILSDFDLYAFTPSALAVSADLRIDTPDRFERIAEAVFSTPRRVWIEADATERLSRLQTMRGFPKTLPRPEHRKEPERVGLAVEIIEPGKAIIDVVWCFGASTIRSVSRELHSIVGHMTALQKKALDAELRIGSSPSHLLIDMTRHLPVSREDFARLAQKPEMALFAQYFRRTHGEEPTLDDLWHLYRLNQIGRVEPRENALVYLNEMRTYAPDRNPIEEARADFDGEITFAIALLAALDAGEGALSVSWRPGQPSRKGTGQRKVSPNDLATDRLATVTMNISDAVLIRTLAAEHINGEPAGPLDGDRRRGPVRHAVRGHLFRARNGKLVYRKPHWRGEAKPSLTVVR